MANEIVIAYLDELDAAPDADIAMHARGDKNHKGFDNDSMIWYIMAWTKIAIITNGGSYRRSYTAFSTETERELETVQRGRAATGHLRRICGKRQLHNRRLLPTRR